MYKEMRHIPNTDRFVYVSTEDGSYLSDVKHEWRIKPILDLGATEKIVSEESVFTRCSKEDLLGRITSVPRNPKSKPSLLAGYNKKQDMWVAWSPNGVLKMKNGESYEEEDFDTGSLWVEEVSSLEDIIAMAHRLIKVY